MSGVHEEPRIFQPGDPFRQHPYVVESFLGEGTSGQSYTIRHALTGDRFALEVAHLADRSLAPTVARSLVEAKATYGIRHPNVVRVFDLACEDDGMVWQIRELLDGESVADLLARAGKLSPIYAIDIATEVAHGLQAAHEQQVIHRDIQPSNVFVTAAGRVAVLDFSLAKLIPSGLETSHREGAKGSTAYMSPEHIMGATPTEQCDVYALGLMLWRMIVGRHPFEGALHDNVTLLRAQLEEDTPSLAAETGLPAYGDEVIHDATAKDPARRYRGMWTFARALSDLRERLLADPAAAPLVQDPPAWERHAPIVRDPNGHQQYRAPSSLPIGGEAPGAPPANIVVADALAEAGEAPNPAALRVTTLKSAVDVGETPNPAAPVEEAPKPPAKQAVAVTMPMSVFVLPTETAEPAKPPAQAATMGEPAKTPVDAKEKRRLVPPAPVSVSEGPITVDTAAPTVRAPRAPLSRWWWAAIVAIPLLIAAGVCLWVFVIAKPSVETKPRPPVVAPKASARPKQR